MALRYSIEKHNVCFPTKVLSERVGRVLNMVISEDTDNGTVCGKGAYVSFDQYEVAEVPAAFEGEILEKAADGNWYVEVKKIDPNAPAVANFFNEASPERTKTVRGFVLGVTDVYELSEDAFEGTPEAGKKVTMNGQKHVVGE